jgi:hypothetical protein
MTMPRGAPVTTGIVAAMAAAIAASLNVWVISERRQ